jgi:hypothetical protein
MALTPVQRKQIISGMGSILETLDGAFLGLGDFLNKVVSAYMNAKNELLDLKTFDFNPKFKTRVISIPRAEEGINELWATIRLDLLGKYQEIRAALDDVKDVFHAEELVNANDPQGAPNALAKSAAALHHLKTFLASLGDLIVKVADLIAIIDDIKRRIETLDDLFLPQGSTKKTVDISYRKRNVT